MQPVRQPGQPSGSAGHRPMAGITSARQASWAVPARTHPPARMLTREGAGYRQEQGHYREPPPGQVRRTRLARLLRFWPRSRRDPSSSPRGPAPAREAVQAGPSCPLGHSVGRRAHSSTKSVSENRAFGPVLKCASVDEMFGMAPDQAAPGSGPVRGAEGSVSRAGEAHGALTPVWIRWRVLVAAAAAGGIAPCSGFQGGSGTGNGFRCGDFELWPVSAGSRAGRAAPRRGSALGSPADEVPSRQHS